ncbi:MAG: hypothetical protein ABSG12_02855 [Steroidobacteraceae bacterium]|jgi:hypothetical protein
MSADVVELRDPYWQIEDPLLRGREIWEQIPSPNAHLGGDENDNEFVGDWEGASPAGYMYAPGSREEIREAAQLLRRAVQLLESACAREWPRWPNGSDASSYEEFIRQQADGNGGRETAP